MIVTVDDPRRVELAAVLRSPGLVVLADVFYPGWTLTVDGRPAEVLRTNRAMRGVALTAGTHRLVYRYRADVVPGWPGRLDRRPRLLAGLGVWSLPVLSAGVVVGVVRTLVSGPHPMNENP